MHETLTSFRKVSLSSNRKFGFTFAGIFFLVAVWPWIFHHATLRWPFFFAAIILTLVTQLVPAWLSPINQAWFKAGLALNQIVNPIFMGLMFYGAVVPFGFLLRQKDILTLKPSPASQTYWVLRDPPGPSAESLEKQF